MRVETFFPPADPADVAAAEARLGVPFPAWLRELYLACDGFVGPTGWHYLSRLGGRDGLVEFNEFLRLEAWAPPWLARVIVFASDTSSGTLTTHFAALDGDLIEWCLGDGDEYTKFDGTVFDLYRREQSRWDELQV